MNPIELEGHEFLRLYVPAAYLVVLGSLYTRGQVLDSFTKTVVLSAFFTLTNSPLLGEISQWRFKAFDKDYKYDSKWKEVVTTSLLRRGDRDAAEALAKIEDEHLVNQYTVYYARRYTSEELKGFRLYKSFGTMYYSLFLVSIQVLAWGIISCVVNSYKVRWFSAVREELTSHWAWLHGQMLECERALEHLMVKPEHFGMPQVIFLCLIGFISRRAARQSWTWSLNQELRYWTDAPRDYVVISSPIKGGMGTPGGRPSLVRQKRSERRRTRGSQS